MQEFKQYGHYMQPRIHKMIQEARASFSETGPALLYCQDPERILQVGTVSNADASRWPFLHSWMGIWLIE